MGTMKERTEHPTEQVLSSKVILNTTLRIKNCTRSISGNTNTYDPKEFANCVKVYIILIAISIIIILELEPHIDN